ncbi:unnamed protein product [Onchocerca flexuosa]|uniref:Uncharacterized protein n=1 Tax=Onchocerca flexuosa TaxID=387005 RepID=A0A183HQ84_9BILA|nr:unnamed protein product [Onchocerca flexuosa]
MQLRVLVAAVSAQNLKNEPLVKVNEKNKKDNKNEKNEKDKFETAKEIKNKKEEPAKTCQEILCVSENGTKLLTTKMVIVPKAIDEAKTAISITLVEPTEEISTKSVQENLTKTAMEILPKIDVKEK